MSRLRNFCDAASVGAAGTFGLLRDDEYEGGVCWPFDVEGRKPGEGDGRLCADEALSLGAGEGVRDVFASKSLNLLFRNSPSNWDVKFLAQVSLYSPFPCCDGRDGCDGGAMVELVDGRDQNTRSNTPVIVVVVVLLIERTPEMHTL